MSDLRWLLCIGLALSGCNDGDQDTAETPQNTQSTAGVESNVGGQFSAGEESAGEDLFNYGGAPAGGLNDSGGTQMSQGGVMSNDSGGSLGGQVGGNSGGEFGGESGGEIGGTSGGESPGGTPDPGPPAGVDQDGDGLDDRWEWSVSNRDAFDWLNSGTDGDGILDGEEDEDQDGLSALEEQAVDVFASVYPDQVIEQDSLNPLRPDLII